MLDRTIRPKDIYRRSKKKISETRFFMKVSQKKIAIGNNFKDYQ